MNEYKQWNIESLKEVTLKKDQYFSYSFKDTLLTLEDNLDIQERGSDYGLTDFEILFIMNLIGNSKWLYNCSIPEKDTTFILDSAIKKLPKFDSKFNKNNNREYSGTEFDGYLFRQNNGLVEFSLKEGDEYIHPRSMSCSLENFDRDSLIFRIKPLSPDKTKAHKIYLFYKEIDQFNNQDDYIQEWQINFESDTKFRILEINKVEDKTIVTMEEL